MALTRTDFAGRTDYLLAASLREMPVLARLRALTASLPEAEMQISPEQGQFLALLARLTDARRCIEIGTFTGYSALAVMLALPSDATLVACDVNVNWTSIARTFWREAGVDERIDLRLQAAARTLDELLAGGAQETFDFAFLDADKGRYIRYYEALLKLIRPGGLIVADNTLGLSGLAPSEQQSPFALAIHRFNEHVHHDERVDLCMVPIGAGFTLLRKR